MSSDNKTADTNPSAVATEPAKAETVKTEAVKTETVKTEAVKTPEANKVDGGPKPTTPVTVPATPPVAADAKVPVIK
ncbi:MAG: hypothetical protein ABI743_05730 [bacterium]